MREVKSSADLRIGMRVQVENHPLLVENGYSEARGEVTQVNINNSSFSFIRDGSQSQETIDLSMGKTWILE